MAELLAQQPTEVARLRADLQHKDELVEKLRAACTALPRYKLQAASIYAEPDRTCEWVKAADLDRVLHPQPQPLTTTDDDDPKVSRVDR